MVDLGEERNVGLFEGVLGGEVDAQFEHTARVGAVGGCHDRTLPLEEIIANRAGAATGGRVALNIAKFLLNATLGHLAFGIAVPIENGRASASIFELMARLPCLSCLPCLPTRFANARQFPRSCLGTHQMSAS